VKSSLFNLYIKKPIKKKLPASLSKKFKKTGTNENTNISLNKRDSSSVFFGYSTADFFYQKEALDKSIDFFAICEK
jgi:hypothetical protein